MSQLIGCAGTGSKGLGAKLMDVEVGMTQTQVLSIFGEPQRRETYGGTEFLIYPTSANGGGQDFMPIAIVDGRVTGIGRNIYDNVVRSKSQADVVVNKR
jgi:hypothetical protein